MIVQLAILRENCFFLWVIGACSILADVTWAVTVNVCARPLPNMLTNATLAASLSNGDLKSFAVGYCSFKYSYFISLIEVLKGNNFFLEI